MLVSWGSELAECVIHSRLAVDAHQRNAVSKEGFPAVGRENKGCLQVLGEGFPAVGANTGNF